MESTTDTIVTFLTKRDNGLVGEDHLLHHFFIPGATPLIPFCHR